MHIAIITPSTTLPVPATKGGAIETLISGLLDMNEKKQLIDITVFTPYDKQARILSKKYVKTQFVWIYYNWINKIINLTTRTYSRLMRSNIPHFGIIQVLYYIRRHYFDFVVIEGDDLQIVPISRLVGKEKVLFHLHARLFDSPKSYEYCEKVLAVSKYIKEQVLINTNKREQDVLVLRNCIDIHKFSRKLNLRYRDVVRSDYGIHKDDVVLCFTGRIVKEKGAKELLESLLLLPKLLPIDVSFKLFIVGSPGSAFGMSKERTEYYSELEMLAKKLGDRVIFTGFIHNSEIPKILASSDISVIPSMYEEPQGLTILESLAAGLPVVTTDSGGIPENITKECAIVIKRDNELITNLASAISTLILSKDERIRMGSAGWLHVQTYSLENYYTDLITILKQK
jgi:glycosyltransferase involved in cell wall biosynthesis